jgi:hypothetical protein
MLPAKGTPSAIRRTFAIRVPAFKSIVEIFRLSLQRFGFRRNLCLKNFEDLNIIRLR